MVHLEWFYEYERYWLMIHKSNILFCLFILLLFIVSGYSAYL